MVLESGSEQVIAKPIKDTSPAALRELLEKNLKWSQIIYEQNRRINSKLMWSAIAGWLRLFIILAPLIIGFLFLPPLIKQFFSQYGSVFTGQPMTNGSPNSFENMLKILPLDSAQKEQFKSLLK